MKTSILFSMIALIAFASFSQITFAIETEQEPGPPQIPEPSPTPEPIRMPEPSPTPNPFPEESDSEKVKRLTEENNNLKQQNKNLQNQISALNNEKSRLQAEIFELNNSIQSLKEITLEQIRVIMDLANQLKEIIYEKIFSPTIVL
jgi:peptidoglycan hydrolase CwlO-like protein